jgi:hypothetical protein
MNMHANVKPESKVDPLDISDDNDALSAAPTDYSTACVTVFTAEDATLSKSISLGPKGDLVKAPAANMVTGWARVMPASSAGALAAIINSCQTTEALCYARPKRFSKDDLRVVLKGRETNGAISRSKDYFTFSDGPGWCLFDADGTGDADVFGILCKVVPGLAKAAHVRRKSTSYGLSDFLGREFPDSGGEHISVPLKKQSDTPRFLEALHRRLWLAGHGFITVGKSGALYIKSPIDTSVKDVTKLIFEGPPILGEGLEQAERPAIPHEGDALDSEAACPDLSAAEMIEFNRLVSAAKRAKKAEAEGARDAWEAPRIADLIANGMAEKKARAEVRAASAGGKLYPEFVLVFAYLGALTVADVARDPKRFDGQALADPIEGPSYGASTAKFYRNGGAPMINSFAHGGCEYTFSERAAVLFADASADASADAAGADKPRRPTVVHKGVRKRATTLEDLNENFGVLVTQDGGCLFVDRKRLTPVAPGDMERRLANVVVDVSEGSEEARYVPAFEALKGNDGRHTYYRTVFTNKPAPADAFNLFRGLGVKPAEGDCSLIVQHIREVIAAGDDEMAECLLSLMAWQIQNIGKPSRTVVVMKSKEHQVGKGVLLTLLSTVYGPSGFIPQSMGQVTGRFNDGIRGKAFLGLDEVVFGGDRRTADAIKSLATATTMGIEGKGLPVVQSQIAVNLWLASNHDSAAHVEEADARYLILDVSARRKNDAKYFAALTSQIKSGGAEAFAHYLLARDVSNFVPWRDIKKDNAAKRAMINESLNPLDARKWLEECAELGEVVGSAQEWIEGAEWTFARLHKAYVEWQKTVRTKAAPQPTSVNRFGEALGKAGLRVKRTKTANVRVLPALGAILGGEA